MKKHLFNLLIAALVVTAIFLLCYPFLSNLIYVNRQTQIIRDYQYTVTEMNEEVIAAEIEKARQYNARQRENPGLSDDYDYSADGYFDIMNHNGIIGYVDIPKIDLYLPFHHGADDITLDKGIGHIPHSGFPLGELGEHVALGGHSGHTSVLFTNLEKLEIGDQFCLHIENVKLTYTVDNIAVVLPDQTELIMPSPSHCYATLFTCSPVGGNSHRLLVRGVLTDRCNVEYPLYQDSKPNVSAVLVSGLLLLALILVSARVIWRMAKKR